jgi:hypothetical protein
MGGQAVSPRDGFFVSSTDALGVRTDVAHVRRWPTANRTEVEANARLIAAAPDLAEALKAIIAWEQHDCGARGCENGCPYDYANVILEQAGVEP